MKAAQPKRKPAAKWRESILELKPSAHVLSILSNFRDKHMPKPNSEADAAHALLLIALMDYGNLMARCRQVENYCHAEGIDQAEYRESILRAKFPRGRLPRPKAAR